MCVGGWVEEVGRGRRGGRREEERGGEEEERGGEEVEEEGGRGGKGGVCGRVEGEGGGGGSMQDFLSFWTLLGPISKVSVVLILSLFSKFLVLVF